MLRGVVVDLIVDQEVDHLAVDLAALVLVGGRTSDAKVKRRVHFWQRWFQVGVVTCPLFVGGKWLRDEATQALSSPRG